MRIRKLFKALAFFCALLIVLPLLVIAWAEKKLSAGEAWYGFWSQCLALVPGFPGTWLRGAFYFGTLDQCSWEIHVGFGSLFVHRGARVGKNLSTGAYCVIGHATIGPSVRLASRVSIPSGKRQHLNADGQLSDATRFERVTIGAGTWIGEAAIVMADVGSDSILSAGSVVIHPMPSGCIVGGNPARVVKELSPTAQPGVVP